MSNLNLQLLVPLASLVHQHSDAMILLVGANSQRVLHVVRGHLVAADSNIKEERLGDVLAKLGKLDPVLIEPVAAEAKKNGRLLGDQLLADQLLQAAELAEALEQQAHLRFFAALTMEGTVQMQPRANPGQVTHRPVAGLMMEAFRRVLPFEVVEHYLAPLIAEPRRLLKFERQEELGLVPAELRLFRRLSQGEEIAPVMESSSPEVVLRLLGGLAALGLWALP